MVEERDGVEVSCDFCGQQDNFDPIDVEALFADSAFTHRAVWLGIAQVAF